jgi:FKBP-type peptidyl-prolyl cis-trans isomerase SlyD
MTESKAKTATRKKAAIPAKTPAATSSGEGSARRVTKTASKSPALEAAAKKAVAKKATVVKKPAAKAAAEKAGSEKAPAKTAAAKKPAAKKPTAKNPFSKQGLTKTEPAKKQPAKKEATKKEVAKKEATKKVVSKKATSAAVASAKKPKATAKQPEAKSMDKTSPKVSAAKPVAAKPSAAKPSAAKPSAAKASAKVVAKPVVAKPVVAKPAGLKKATAPKAAASTKKPAKSKVANKAAVQEAPRTGVSGASISFSSVQEPPSHLTMRVDVNRVVAFHYRLREIRRDGSASAWLEESFGRQPLLYLHGHGNVVPGLEQAMAAKKAGDAFSITLAPEQAYGNRTTNDMRRIPIKHLHRPPERKFLVPGVIVSVNTKQGLQNALVLKVGKFNVDLDSNHPFAGRTLQYQIEILGVREATPEEIAHRHVHGPGGHQH